jgi:tetratricopeptide (TPR) repeat protein
MRKSARLPYRELGAFDRAMKSANEAKALAESAQNGRDYREALALRASIEKTTGHYDDALASWQEALAQDRNDGVERDILGDELSIAALHAKMGKTNEARVQLRSLRPRARASGIPDRELLAVFAMGESFEKKCRQCGVLLRAVAAFHRSVGRDRRSEIQTDYLSGQWRYDFEEVARFYAKTYAVTGDARWSDRAFRTMERAKARGLLELMAQRVSQDRDPEEEDSCSTPLRS